VTEVKVPGRARRWFVRTGWRHAVGIAMLFFALFPVWFVIIAALSDTGTLSSQTLVPESVTLEQYRTLVDNYPYWQWFFNSLAVSVVVAFGTVMLAAAAAYAFSRLRFKGRRPGVLALLLIQMFPAFLALVAIYLLLLTTGEVFSTLGLNSRPALILVFLGGALGVNAWLMKGFFDTIPAELDESARVDGATPAQIFWGVILPLAAPVLAVVGIITFVFLLNEFIITSALLQEKDKFTLPVGLRGYINEKYSEQWGPFAAGAVLAAAPVAVLVMAFQRFFVRGLTSGAVKG
jgi:arabinogalactan oligomer/maltooligosaccharide transport system permease protein